MEPKNEKIYFGKETHPYYWFTQTLELTKVALKKSMKLYLIMEKYYLSQQKNKLQKLAEVAKETDQYFVNYRWLGGMLLIGELYLIQLKN